jgi:hypothetical protein
LTRATASCGTKGMLSSSTAIFTTFARATRTMTAPKSCGRATRAGKPDKSQRSARARGEAMLRRFVLTLAASPSWQGRACGGRVGADPGVGGAPRPPLLQPLLQAKVCAARGTCLRQPQLGAGGGARLTPGGGAGARLGAGVQADERVPGARVGATDAGGGEARPAGVPAARGCVAHDRRRPRQQTAALLPPPGHLLRRVGALRSDPLCRGPASVNVAHAGLAWLYKE